MTPAAATLLAHFEAAAKAAGVAETELRKSLAAQIAKAEQRRVYAFRRSRLIAGLARAVPAPAVDDEAWALQKRAICDELGWSTLSASYEAILDRMQPLAAAVRAALASPGEAEAAAVESELQGFEAWFGETHGKAFYVLFDQYVPEVPVVDF
ncbi:MAG: hypothetical protein NW223_10625 [Hyphomicrobiaceae bacterium]|nr:hypothetical protein [Hyphomicrobiaceae bacterium]